MNLRRHPPAAVRWLLAALLPFLAGAIEYIWLNATATGLPCEAGPWSPTFPSLALLVFLVPWAIATYVWAETGSLRKAWAPMLVTTVVAIPLAYFVLIVWVGSQGCLG
ncbi:MAG TPA: hypothetical protein VGF70_14945 [Solirubrobacteraceae bacterium]